MRVPSDTTLLLADRIDVDASSSQESAIDAALSRLLLQCSLARRLCHSTVCVETDCNSAVRCAVASDVLAKCFAAAAAILAMIELLRRRLRLGAAHARRFDRRGSRLALQLPNSFSGETARKAMKTAANGMHAPAAQSRMASSGARAHTGRSVAQGKRGAREARSARWERTLSFRVPFSSQHRPTHCVVNHQRLRH